MSLAGDPACWLEEELKSLFGQDQFSIAGDAQLVMLALVLDQHHGRATK